MSRYNQQYGSNFYDPVGSQASQPTSYTYQGSAANSAYQSVPNVAQYGSSNYQNYGNAHYNARPYESNAQESGNSTSSAAAALSSLSEAPSYGQTSLRNPSNSSDRYGSTAASSYNSMPNRHEEDGSPLYSNTQTQSSYGRLGMPSQPQSNPTTYGAPQPAYPSTSSNASMQTGSYSTAYAQPQSQPQRYNSPLHAVMAQQSSRQQSSPQMSTTSHHNRQHSASVEPSATTVDPSQVYDNRAELQRKAQVEAEKRRKYEAEQAAKRAEENRVRADEEEKTRKAEEGAAKKVEEQKRKNEQKRKAREEKKQSKNAASALQRLASGAAESPEAPPENEDEAQMRAMFRKMREFNAKNPTMLAKLWEEERQSHEASKNSPTPAPPATVPTTEKSAASPPVPKAQTAKSKAASKAPAVPPVRSPTTLQRPSLQQAKSSQPAASSSLWPPHKKGALAEVTAKWLMSLSQNSGKMIHAEQVLNILDRNPSYVQLCESLESLGVRFDRSTLARELLKAVPDGMKPQSATSPSLSRAGVLAPVNGAPLASPHPSNMGKKRASGTPDAMPSARTSTVQYEALGSLAADARQAGNVGGQSFQSVNMHGSPPRQHQSPYFVTAPSFPNGSRASFSMPLPAEVKPKVKQEEPPRPPADKEEAARKRTFGDLVDLTQDDSDDEGPPPKKIAGALTNATSANGVQQQQSSAKYLAKPISFHQFMSSGSGRAESALMSAHYPGPQQVNGKPYHGQASAPPTQGATAPTPAPAKSRGPTAEQAQMSRLRGKLLVEPIMRDRVQRKSTYDSRTIARDVLLATGRHPDMRGLNGHLSVMQKLLGQHGLDSDGGNRSDLATIRWDVIDPQPPKADKKEQEAEGGETADTEAAPQPNDDTDRVQTPVALPTRKKIGRPRKHTPQQAEGLGTANASTSRPATPSSAPQHSEGGPNMAAPPPSSDKVVGYNAFNQVGPDGKRKKGRPFGWRKDVHSREAQGLPSATHPSKKATTTSSTPRAPKPAAESVVRHFQPFACGWAGCKSLLHNLETLTKHLVKLHGRPEQERGGLVCRWQGCTVLKARSEAAFDGIEPWLAHVDEAHLKPIRWTLGDGPTVVGGE